MCAAAEAQKSWRRTPAPRRGEILFRAAEILVRNKEQFARDLTEEMGKVLKEARGDIQEAIDMTYYMAGEGRRAFGQTTPSELPRQVRDVRARAGRRRRLHHAVELPDGDPVVEDHARARHRQHRRLQAVAVFAEERVQPREGARGGGLPPGVVNLVFGEGAEAGAAVIEHPRVHLISFTGSNAVGKQIAVQCAELGKPVSLEMGGKNAIIVLDDADLDLALDGVVWSAFGTTGQRCTAASRVIVQAGVYDEFASNAHRADEAAPPRQRPRREHRRRAGREPRPARRRSTAYMPVGAADGATLAMRRRDGYEATASIAATSSSRRCSPTRRRACVSRRRRSSDP